MKTVIFCILLLLSGQIGLMAQTAPSDFTGHDLAAPTGAHVSKGIFSTTLAGNTGQTTTVTPDVSAQQAVDALNNLVILTHNQYAQALDVYKEFYQKGNSDASATKTRDEKLGDILTNNQWQKAQSANLVGAGAEK